MNRVGLFSFFDNQGIVDDYIIYLLKSIKKYCSEIHCIANGLLITQSINKLETICNTVTQRENNGFDAWGYRTLINQIGYDKLCEYDEILCFNHTCFGPIFSLESIFNKMENQDCDFWGLYFIKAPQKEIYKQGIYIPSYFVTYRKSLVKNESFREFWNNLPKLETYNDAVKLYEQSQMQYFVNNGFSVKVAFDFSEYQKDSQWWFLEKQSEMLIEDKLPLLKRRPFFKDKKGRINGEFYRKVIPFLNKHTNYNTDLIYQNLNRTQNISILKQPNIFEKFWWNILAYCSKKRDKYKKRLENLITEEEIIKLFNNNSNGGLK